MFFPKSCRSWSKTKPIHTKLRFSTQIHKVSTSVPLNSPAGWLLTPEDDLSTTDLLLILGKSANSCCSRHVCGQLSDGAVGGVLSLVTSSSSQKTYKKLVDFSLQPIFPFSVSLFHLLFLSCWTPLSYSLLPATLLHTPLPFLSDLFPNLTLLLVFSSLPLPKSLSAVAQLCCSV